MKLLGVEQVNGLTHRTWAHTGDDGKDRITTETVQDMEPVFNRAKFLATNTNTKDFKYQGTIPANLINHLSYSLAKTWGVKNREAFQELMQSKTDRSKSVWRMLLTSRDFLKLQARNYVP